MKPASPGEFRPVPIGPMAIWPPVVLAPMAGVTNAPFRELCRRHGAGLYVNQMITARAIVERPDLTARLDSITVPTLVMVGERDWLAPCARRDHSLIKGSRFVLRRGCGHGFRWRTEAFVAEIEAFIDDVDAGRPVSGEREV